MRAQLPLAGCRAHRARARARLTAGFRAVAGTPHPWHASHQALSDFPVFMRRSDVDLGAVDDDQRRPTTGVLPCWVPTAMAQWRRCARMLRGERAYYTG